MGSLRQNKNSSQKRNAHKQPDVNITRYPFVLHPFFSAKTFLT
jgi:hypothetical protein